MKLGIAENSAARLYQSEWYWNGESCGEEKGVGGVGRMPFHDKKGGGGEECRVADGVVRMRQEIIGRATLYFFGGKMLSMME